MEIKTEKSRWIIKTSHELRIPEVAEYSRRYCAEIQTEILNQKLESSGPWIFISYNLPKNGTDLYRIEFCMQINNPETYKGNFEISLLHDFKCASAIYIGNLRGLFSEGYKPLLEKIAEEELIFTGESREVYHRWDDPKSAENNIEIQFGIK